MSVVYSYTFDSGETVGLAPVNFTIVGADNTYAVDNAITPISSPNVCKVVGGSAAAHHMWAYDGVVVPSTGDYTARVAFYVPGVAFERWGVIARASSTPSAYVMMHRTSGGSPTMRFSSLVSDVETVKVTTGTLSPGLSSATWYWIKFYCVGTAMKGTYWKDGDAEPSTWLIDTTDSTISNSAKKLGVYQFMGINTVDFDSLSADDGLSARNNNLTLIGVS